MEQDHTASFISAFASLQPVADQEELATELASLDGWSIEQLKAEVVRLRRELRGADPLETNTNAVPDALLQSHLASFANAHAAQQSPHPPPHPHTPQPAFTVNPTLPLRAHTPPPAASTSRLRGRKRALPDDAATPRRSLQHDKETGKRVEKAPRRVELQRAIRTKMRYAMNIGLEDDLPAPSIVAMPGASQEGHAYWVPNWPAGGSDTSNGQWLDRICSQFIAEARSFSHWTKVPPEDLDEETVKGAARTAFQNFAKRYMAEVDPKQAKKKEKYVKNRRRWARKDLKQKRRSKAALDPSFEDQLPPAALHIDYMSSEYSSAGDDSDDEPTRASERHQQWLAVLRTSAPSEEPKGKGGWADGQSAKVLEVRTPTWRSARLDALYRQLDTISASQAAARAAPASTGSFKPANGGAAMRLGHVAPSHRRFTLDTPLMRRGRAPRDGGEGWMWAAGQVGVWPGQELGEVAAAVVAAEAAAGLQEGMESEDRLVGGIEEGEGIELDPVDALVEGWTEGV